MYVRSCNIKDAYTRQVCELRARGDLMENERNFEAVRFGVHHSALIASAIRTSCVLDLLRPYHSCDL
jgi:hypothetical protein